MPQRKTLKERILKFLDERIEFHEEELRQLKSMKDRIGYFKLTDEEFNSLLGVIKFWFRKRAEKDAIID